MSSSVATAPPARPAASSTVTSTPARARVIAAASPFGPLPITIAPVIGRGCQARESWQDAAMAKYTLNDRAVEHAMELIAKRQYVLDSPWGDVQPTRRRTRTRSSRTHSWEEYAEWHLGLTDGATDGTKARYAFVFGDFRRLHRMGLIACHYRAAEWRHKEIELAAHDLLQALDNATGGRPVLAGPRRAPAARVAAHERAVALARRAVGVPAGSPPRGRPRTSPIRRSTTPAGASCPSPRTGSCTATARPPTRTSPTRSRSSRRTCPTPTRRATTGAASGSRTAGPRARRVLRFGGADSHLRVWLNGTELGEACGSRLAHEFEAGGALRRDGENVLAVRVAQWSAGSYLEDQDMWWLSGLFRGVELLARPRAASATCSSTRTADGTLRVDADVPARVVVPELGVDAAAGETVAAGPVEPWSAELPRLYDAESAPGARRSRCGSASARSPSRTASCASTAAASCCAASTGTSGTPTAAAR